MDSWQNVREACNALLTNPNILTYLLNTSRRRGPLSLPIHSRNHRAWRLDHVSLWTYRPQPLPLQPISLLMHCLYRLYLNLMSLNSYHFQLLGLDPTPRIIHHPQRLLLSHVSLHYPLQLQPLGPEVLGTYRLQLLPSTPISTRTSRLVLLLLDLLSLEISRLQLLLLRLSALLFNYLSLIQSPPTLRRKPTNPQFQLVTQDRDKTHARVAPKENQTKNLTHTTRTCFRMP